MPATPPESRTAFWRVSQMPLLRRKRNRLAVRLKGVGRAGNVRVDGVRRAVIADVAKVAGLLLGLLNTVTCRVIP